MPRKKNCRPIIAARKKLLRSYSSTPLPLWIILRPIQTRFLFSPAFKFPLVGGNYKMEISSESPQNDPAGKYRNDTRNQQIWWASFIYVFNNKFLRYPESRIPDPKVKTPKTNLQLGLPVINTAMIISHIRRWINKTLSDNKVLFFFGYVKKNYRLSSHK